MNKSASTSSEAGLSRKFEISDDKIYPKNDSQAQWALLRDTLLLGIQNCYLLLFFHYHFDQVSLYPSPQLNGGQTYNERIVPSYHKYTTMSIQFLG